MAIVLNNKGLDQPKKQTTTNTSTYATLQYGSTGDDVKKLQSSLGFTGADVDGIFGQKTQQAVIDFQKANNLDVDGIAGNQTLSLLYSGNANTSGGNTNTGTGTVGTNSSGNTGSSVGTNTGGATNGGNTGTGTNSSYTTSGYSQEVIDAFNLLNQFSANRPGNYTPVWQDEADAYLTQYQNRDAFSYDFNADPLYNQYKDQYIQQGRMAMMDTMGQASAMTGGYGNTYAQTVGQQAYNQQLGQLNEIMPDLYGMAYDRYNQEGQDLLNMYDIYMGKEQNERQMYQDSVDNWYKEYSMLQDDANTKYNRWWNENVSTLSDGDSSDYTALTYDEYQKWTKSFEKENTVKGVEHLGDMLQAAGYDPAFVAEWVDFYKTKILGGNVKTETPPSVGHSVLNVENNRLTF